MKYDTGVLFDFDGTLADSLGIGLGSYNYALAKINEPPRNEDEIKKLFGASADRILHRLLEDDEKALRAFDYYLEHEVCILKISQFNLPNFIAWMHFFKRHQTLIRRQQ